MSADTFDRMIGALHGLPDVLASKPATLREVVAMVGEAQTFIVQTYRQKDKGDTVFLEVVSGAAHTRLVLPNRVVEAIVRQRDALSARARSRQGREQAQARKEAGIEPAFLKGLGKARKAGAR